jgi:hypothetical protein
VAETIADQVFARVEALMSEGGSASRAAAFRVVADEMDRSVSATSSAYYAGARKARDAAPEGAAEPAARPRAGRGSSRREASALYAEMLPLVEAGATVEQAARRFGGDEEDAEEIAAGFARWLARQEGAAEPAAGARLAELETELQDVRAELARAREAIARAREALDSAAGSPP